MDRKANGHTRQQHIYGFSDHHADGNWDLHLCADLRRSRVRIRNADSQRQQ